MLPGCGEPGKEAIIALQRLGCDVIGVDRCPDPTGMRLAHHSHRAAMPDGAALREPIEHVRVNGDCVESWQPMTMPPDALRKSREVARAITGNIGGRAINVPDTLRSF